MAAAVGGAVTALTGCDKKTGSAAGAAMVTIGGLMLKIPHWLGKLVGVVLVSGGGALKFYFQCPDGHREEVSIELTDEQKKKIEAAVAKGQKFVVTDPAGNAAHHDGK
jgi:hypothetical protein